jgi:hypothetical protein
MLLCEFLEKGLMSKFCFCAVLFIFTFCMGPVSAQEVYVGVADGITVPIGHPEQWRYVQENADGYYVNYIVLNRILRGYHNQSQTDLNKYNALFKSHNVYLESDVRDPLPGATGSGGGGAHDGASAEEDRRYIDMLHEAGFSVKYTSLNYGWNKSRADNLTKYKLLPREKKRLNFVQTGPWAMNGNINGPSDKAHVKYNEHTRAFIVQSDGVSTDGPMGYWKTNYHHIREADISLVRFAHAHHKKVMIMLSPYHANQPGYDPKTDFLTEVQEAVHSLESAQAIPDMYAIFEYATSIPAVPEAVDGRPVSTTMGGAFWLIHHLRDPKNYP